MFQCTVQVKILVRINLAIWLQTWHSKSNVRIKVCRWTQPGQQRSLDANYWLEFN